MGWVVRILLLLLVLRALVRLVAGVFQGLRGERPEQVGGASRVRSKERAVPLVRDPVCGTYVVAARALSSTTRDSTHYFCSEACRDRFERERSASRTA